MAKTTVHGGATNAETGQVPEPVEVESEDVFTDDSFEVDKTEKTPAKKTTASKK